tara:strand:+ start:1401 stop:1709 length:309 start_codon:yes stop_codon:yes gene_type:complete
MTDKKNARPTTTIEEAAIKASDMATPYNSSVTVDDDTITVKFVIAREHATLSQAGEDGPWFHAVNLHFAGLTNGFKLSGWRARDPETHKKIGQGGLWIGVRA